MTLASALELHQQGELAAAAREYERALEEDPTAVAALNNLASIHLAGGRFDEAGTLLQRSLDIEPGRAATMFNLGLLHERQHQLGEAESWYRRVLTREPENPNALNNLANILFEQGALAPARDLYIQSTKVQPTATSWRNLGKAHLALRQPKEAEAAFLKSLELAPDRADVLVGLATAHKLQNAYPEAVQRLQRAAQAHPTHVAAHNDLGVLALEENHTEEALAHFERALRVNPTSFETLFNFHTALPILYDDQSEIDRYRARFTAGLRALLAYQAQATTAQRTDILSTLCRRCVFYLQYQGGHDRELQELFGQMVTLAVRDLPPYEARPRAGARLRVGYVSAYFRQHTVGKLTVGFVEARDQSDRDVFVYSFSLPQDPLALRFARAATVFRCLPRHLEQAVRILREDALDVVVFADIGMEPIVQLIAAARVAPQQMLFWGHPVTSGIAAVDHFISCDEMEPEGGVQHYSERLIALPSPGVVYARPVIPTRADHEPTLPASGPLLLSCQSLYKYHPAYDHALASILARVPAAHLVLLEHHRSEAVTECFRARLSRVLDGAGVDPKRCIFVPRLSHAAYLRLNQRCDLYLDTWLWSGGNTTLEALSTGLPVVTLPGPTMRSRHTSAFLRQLELPFGVARDEANYIELAVEAACSATLRADLRRHIDAHADARLFGQTAVVAALDRVIGALSR